MGQSPAKHGASFLFHKLIDTLEDFVTDFDTGADCGAEPADCGAKPKEKKELLGAFGL
jgi:hypothetical protein